MVKTLRTIQIHDHSGAERSVIFNFTEENGGFDGDKGINEHVNTLLNSVSGEMRFILFRNCRHSRRETRIRNIK